MSIISWQFYALLTATMLVSAATPRAWRKYVLLAASVFFYLSAGVSGLIVIALLLAVNGALFNLIVTTSRESVRDRAYWASMIVNALVFCTFKLVFEPAPGSAPTVWNLGPLVIAYPLGLSFIVLMLHSAQTDAYSGQFRKKVGVTDFALFGGFFPYVSAGPVERLRHMSGEFEQAKGPSLEDFRAGAALIALGLFKKVVVATRLQQFVEMTFANASASASATAAAILLNTAYIYCDFSGYTDIVRGAARCLGISISINFDRPFTSTSITEFWRRWHISFSSWLRDYLYMPLAFTMRRWRQWGTIIALLVTFLLCGFWHRASWTFVLFGLLHGLVMAAELRWANTTAGPKGHLRRAAAHLYTLVFLFATIVLFSAKDLGQAGEIFSRLWLGSRSLSPAALVGQDGILKFGLLLFSMALWQALDRWHGRARPGHLKYFTCICAILIVFMGRTGEADFIYARF